MIGALDTFEALRAWDDAAIETQQHNDRRGDCTLSSLAGELRLSDEVVRAELSRGFTRWKAVLENGFRAALQTEPRSPRPCERPTLWEQHWIPLSRASTRSPPQDKSLEQGRPFETANSDALTSSGR